MSKITIKKTIKENRKDFQFNFQFNSIYEDKIPESLLQFGKYDSNKPISYPFYKPYSKFIDLKKINLNE